MRRPTIIALTVAAVALHAVGALAADYFESTEHYRTIERFEQVSINVTSEFNITPELEAFNSLADRVTDDIEFYLEHRGISVVRSDANSEDLARLEVILRSRFRRFSNNYEIATTLISPAGTVIDETLLYHIASSSSPNATSQQLAEVIADDVLLMWHPAKDVLNGKPPKGKSANTLTGLQVSVDKGQSRFTWEAFPSERLLVGADFSADDVSDVSYELRIRPYWFRFVQGRTKGTFGVHRVQGILKAEYTLPFLLPSCEEARWSVRAHFMLRGTPRVTEWSRHSSGGRKFVARRTRTTTALFHQIDSMHGNYPFDLDSTEKFDCHSAERQPEDLLPYLEIEALQTGESIAAMALISQACEGNQCEARMTTEEASEKLAECLADEFKKRDLDVSVLDMAGLLQELPIRPDVDSAPADTNSMYSYLGQPENRDYLTSRGIRYAVTADMTMNKTGKDVLADSNVAATIVAPVTYYESTVDSQLFDILNSQVAASIASSAQGEKGVVVPMILFVPVAAIPYGSKRRIENRACDALARRLTLGLKGGVSGWPDGFFVDPTEASWDYAEIE
jgi:hypothetical protein